MKKLKFILLCKMFVLFTSFSFAQQRSLSGTVKDAKGQPVVGATIKVMGTDNTGSTDEKGAFTLLIAEGEVNLRVSAIGFTTKEVSVLNAQSVQVVLDGEAHQLEEVVIQTAYGTSKKASFTGSATTISAKQLENVNTSNVAQGLQGLSAGVQVTNTSGRPGADPQISIRGLGSLSAETSPLYVVDGVPSDVSLNSYSPSDIASITVLKDAAATSLYGSRAANGVVLITTKRGASGSPRVNARGGWSTSDFAVKFPEKVSVGKQWELAWEGLYNDAVDFDKMTDQAAREYATNRLPSVFWNRTPLTLSNGTTREYRSGWNMDYPVGLDGKLKPEAERLWNEDIFEQAFDYRLKQDYGVDFSGTLGENNSYFTSFSYLGDKGVHVSDNFKRFTGRVALNSKMNDWLTVSNSIMYMNSGDQNGGFDARVFRTMPNEYSAYLWDYETNSYSISPFTGRPHLEEGVTTGRAWWPRWNAFGALTEDKNSQTDNLQTVSSFNFQLLPGLSLKTTYSFQLVNNFYHMWKSPERENQLMPSEGYVQRDAYRNFYHTFNNVLTFDRTFADKHHINVLAGQEIYSRTLTGSGTTRAGLALPYFTEIPLASNDPTSTSSFIGYSLASFFAKAEYDYQQKYFISASARTDGSSRFHKDHRWGRFFSLGGAWRMSEESFMENTKSWLQDLKLKASYGEVGNDRVNSYFADRALYGPTSYAGNAAVTLSQVANPTIKWETNIQSNVGIEFMLFNNLSGSVEYFSRKSKDLLLGRPLAPSLGMDAILENIGDVENKGYEIDLSYSPIRSDRFEWRVGLNATGYKNVITNLPSEEEQFNFSVTTFKWKEGGSRYDIYAPSYAGVNPANGHNQWWKYDFDESGAITGRTVTENYNEVNVDRQRIHQGSVLPDVFGALTNNLRFRNFDLSFMLYYSFGGKIYDYNYSESNVLRENFAAYDNLDNRWQQEGDVTDIAKIYTYRTFDAFSNARYSDQYLFNNDFVRLKNVMFGYTLPSALTNRWGLASMRLHFRGDNLLTFGNAKRRGTDPENFGNNADYGVTMGVVDATSGVPALRSYTLGVNISF